MEAAAAGRNETAQVLIGHGAKLDMQDVNGWTALLDATAMGNAAIVKSLCDAGANPTIRNNYGRNAFDYAHGINDPARDEAFHLPPPGKDGVEKESVLRTLEVYVKKYSGKNAGK